MARSTGLTVVLSADIGKFQSQLSKARGEIAKMTGKSGMWFSKAVTAGVAAAGAALVGLGVASIKAAAGMEMTRTAFTQMLGSAEKAETFIKDLQKFAAETPFEFEQVKGAAQKFLAFGFTAEQVIPVLTAVGDAAAGLGIGEEGINRLTLAMGQMASKGKVSGEEMRQLAEAGIPAWQMLADKMGVSIPEAMDKVSQGGVSAAVGLEALVGGMENKFGGMMDKMSESTTGLWSTFSDNAGQAMIAIGESLIENLGIKSILKELGDATTEFTQTLQSSGLTAALRTLIPPELEIAIYGVAAALTIAAIPAVVSFGASAGGLALSGVRALMGGLSLLSGLGPTTMAVFTSLTGSIAGVGQLSLMTTQNLTGFSRVLGIARFAVMGLWSALGPVGLILLAVSAAIIYMMANGISLTSVFNRMGVSTGLLQMTVNNLKIAWDHLWGTLKLLFNMVLALVKPFATLAVIIGTVLLHAIAFTIGVISVFINFVLMLFNGLMELGFVIQNQVLGALSSLGSYFDNLTGGALSTMIEKVKEAVAWFTKLIGLSNSVSGGATGAADFRKSEDTNTKESEKSLDFSNFGGGGGEKAAKGKKGAQDKLAEEAKRISGSIGERWYEMFSNRIDLIDRWYQEELTTLEKSKGANANYTRDLQRLNEITEEKKRMAILETEKQQRSSLEKITDMVKGSTRAFDLSNMSAGDKVFAEIDNSYVDKIESIKKSYQSLSDEYRSLTQEDQAFFLQSLSEKGVAYEIAGNGDIQFARMMNQEIAAAAIEREKQITQASVEHQALRADIEEAMNQNRMDRLQELLTAENAMKLNNYEADRQMMATYQEVALAAHATTAQLMANLYSTAFGGLKTAISDALMGTKSLGEAFKELGKSLLKVVADFVAKKIAGNLMLLAMSKSSHSVEEKLAAKTGATVAASWSKAAAMVSLATMGSNSAPAIAGMIAATSAAMGLSQMPAFAHGGIVTGPTVGLIGEAGNDEAVLPLTTGYLGPIFSDVMKRLGLGGDESIGSPFTINYTHTGDINDKADRDGIMDDLNREFISQRGGRM